MAAAAAMLPAFPAHGGIQPSELMVTWDASSDAAGPAHFNWATLGDAPIFGEHSFEGDNRTWTGWLYTGTDSGANNEWTLSWSIVFNDGSDGVAAGDSSFVSTYIVVTNNLTTTQNFDSLITLPIDRLIVSPMMHGGIEGSVTDLTLDDATVSAPTGSRIYSPQIDGFDESAGFLLEDPFSVNAGFLQQMPIDPVRFGEPTLEAASRDATTDIGILLDFDLSGGDSVTLIADFEISSIPGPGAVSVLALAGLLTGRRRRRRA